ncbi:5'-nucleotidase C-terminal domain-containing protein [Hyunsoonleella rubra]|uniref:5'-nucleotidase C-terminal domain-containing protein n=1 Tax=Hyunsoonleella rubra TaxID=1737062 RepID=A0ABW5TEB5_9FLAO
MKFYAPKSMNFKHLALLMVSLLMFNCKQRKLDLKTIEGQRISVDSTLHSNESIEAFIAPYRNHIEKDLSTVLAYATGTLSKYDGKRNTSIGNLMADIVKIQTNPVFKQRTGHDIDAVILNNGGIRSTIPEGNITPRTAYNVMPFENEVVVVGLKKVAFDRAIKFLLKTEKPHPIGGLELVADRDGNLLSAKINGGEIDPNRTYYVATSDYLFHGGDNMKFFKQNEGFYDLDYKIRNAMMDYFKKIDTIRPKIDDRFIIK